MMIGIMIVKENTQRMMMSKMVMVMMMMMLGRMKDNIHKKEMMMIQWMGKLGGESAWFP